MGIQEVDRVHDCLCKVISRGNYVNVEDLIG